MGQIPEYDVMEMWRAEQVTLQTEGRKRGGFIEEDISEHCCKVYFCRE